MKPKRSKQGRSRVAPKPQPLAPGPPLRLEVVDAARGAAVAMMIAYHFCFDLTWYHWADWAMLDDAPWIAWRASIVASFLFLVGISLALRDARERDAADGVRAAHSLRTFIRRWAQIAGAALLVSIGSALLFPETFIYFGVLHFVALALWICKRAPRLGGWAAALGIVAIAAGVLVHDAAFDARWVNWIGFAAHKPITEDYVPLFPWLGVLLLGCTLGALWTRRDCRLSPAIAALWLHTPRGSRALFCAAGRWSLTIYLLHQPILLGVMGLIKSLV